MTPHVAGRAPRRGGTTSTGFESTGPTSCRTRSPQGPLDAISSPAPGEGSDVNWLNIFYAIEWAVFAGFAFYLWYRLARDAWEKEVEELEDAEPAAS